MRTKKAMTNVLTGVLSLIITSVLSFVISKLFVQSIGVQASGLNSVYTNVISILSVSELGIAGAINFNLYKPVLVKDYKKISLIMSFYKKCYQIIGIIIFALALLVSNYVHLFVTDSTYSKIFIQISFLICAMSTVLSYFLAYHRNLIYAYQDNYLTVLADFIIRIIFSLIQIVCLLLLKNYLLYLVVNLGQNVVGNLVVAIISKKRYPDININLKEKDRALEKQVMQDVKDLAIIQVSAALINSTDSLIISKILGVLIAGIYSFYAQILNLLLSLINTIFNSLGASLGNLLAEDNQDNTKRVLDVLIYFSFFLGLFFASGIAGTIIPFINLWLGADFIISKITVIVLSLNLYIYIQRQVVTYYLRTGGYHKKLVRPLIIEAIINLVVSIILAYKIGLTGVFVGTVVSALYGWIQNSHVLFRMFNLEYRRYWGKEILFGLIFGIQLLVSHFVILQASHNLNVLLNVLVSGVISIILPTMVILFYVFRKEDFSFIRKKFGAKR